MFPITRSRRLRSSKNIRSMVRETTLSVNDFIYPLFVCEGKGIRNEVTSMPGVYNLSVDEVIKEAKEVESLGIKSVILFGIPDHKDEEGSGAFGSDGIVQKAIKAIKDYTDLYVITDVCMCEYTSQNMLLAIMDHLEMQQILLQHLAAEKHIKWTLQIEEKH